MLFQIPYYITNSFQYILSIVKIFLLNVACLMEKKSQNFHKIFYAQKQ